MSGQAVSPLRSMRGCCVPRPLANLGPSESSRRKGVLGSALCAAPLPAENLPLTTRNQKSWQWPLEPRAGMSDSVGLEQRRACMGPWRLCWKLRPNRPPTSTPPLPPVHCSSLLGTAVMAVFLGAPVRGGPGRLGSKLLRPGELVEVSCCLSMDLGSPSCSTSLCGCAVWFASTSASNHTSVWHTDVLEQLVVHPPQSSCICWGAHTPWGFCICEGCLLDPASCPIKRSVPP